MTKPGRRVVITGVGAVSSIGTSVDEFLTGLRAGRSEVHPISAFETTGFEYANGCEVTGFEPERWIERLDPAELGRAARFAVAAARMAAGHAGLTPQDLAAGRVLVAIGTTDGETRDLDRLVAQDAAEPGAMDPRIARRASPSRLAASVAREFALADAEAVTIPTACAAGNYAIGHGLDAIRAGDADLAFCGGADAICRKTFAGFYRLGTIAPDRCRPFDLGRQGILTGEGSGMLVLESLESALARGARIHAEVLGYGLNCDAYHQVAPLEESVADCMRLAVADAGVKPDEVDLISAHGTGTKANDSTEAKAIHAVFGDRPPRTVSMKSMLGHTMGAASALAAIGCTLALEHAFIPPTVNHTTTDPECGLDCVPNESVAADLRIVQNNGLAFGGNNAVVVFGRYDEGAA
ncbi:beta-ketoacyl-[acyl-carrier-protein] synthase family protein [Streptomyces spirodelae]|uniref:Beta-ketoacyl-[acyl-carrier-protein] synthase family protein n=1 Tax=Streptomyces spirodelae TaxID=2812904 RepID=A0ABS3WLJ2_9ACTN|nr:beta-ketoacyl-[acyl-carrier-protein] synthase family protein [Streptomyces spirodelae]MBO8183994.1 beta-ketoacyl-[acyl-carrier-protein] synthase family protein [Streptomyces spirodelae]